jgi:hypothetical protein
MLTIIFLIFKGQPIILPLSGQIITEDDIKKNLEWFDILLWMLISLAFISFLIVLAARAIDAQEIQAQDLVSTKYRKNHKPLINLLSIRKHIDVAAFEKKVVSLSETNDANNINKSNPSLK